MIVAACVALVYLALALRLARLRRRAPPMPAPAAATPPTTVLLPVRDEAVNLVDCVATLLAQPAAVAIRIVDDGSSDATPRLLAGLAAGSNRIAALVARPLPPGWTGKVNALATAFDGVTTHWTLLTDADARHAPDLLARAHAAIGAADRPLDALSLAGTEEAHGVGESLITPPAFALLDLLLGDWGPHARGEAAAPLANGQYFLVRTQALRAIGGFEAIVGRPLDDVALARALHAAGFRVGFRRAGGALRVRMYRGFRASLLGWRRNFALILGDRSTIVWRVAALALLSAVSLAWLATSGPGWAVATAWCGGSLASGLARRSSGNDPVAGLLFPLDVCALSATLLLARSDRRRGRLAPWRGRSLAPD